MNLPKQHIQFIDKYLKHSGVTLVDVRIEMVDHIASEMEAKLENGEEDTFYNAFKKYMIKGKKELLNDYEEQKLQRTENVVLETLKSFIKLDAIFIGLMGGLLVFFLKDYFFIYFNKYNLVLTIPAVLLYLVLFRGAIKTSIASSLLIIMLLPGYSWLYFKNIYALVLAIGFYVAYGSLVKRLGRNNSIKKSRMLSSVISCVIIFPLFFLVNNYSEFLTGPKTTLVYYVFQLMHWYIVFKQIFKYKKELDSKYKLLLG